MLILQGPEKPVHALVFAPAAATLYAVHEYVGVHAWYLADRTGAGLEVGGVRVFGEFAVHAGGRWAFGRRPDQDTAPDNDSCVLDLKTGRSRPFNFLGVVGQHLAFAPDGTRLVTVGHSDYDTDRPAKARSDRLYGWKITAASPRYVWHLNAPEDAQPWRVVFAGNDTIVTEDWVPQEPRVAIGYQPRRSRLAVRSAATGKVLRTIDAPTNRAEQLLGSPDGKQLVVRGGTQMWVYDATDWKKPPLAVEGKHSNRHQERAACFHPSAPYLLLANTGPSVVVYDTTTWKPVRKWKWGAGTLRTCAVSPDGTLAAAGGPRGTVVVWDLDL